jgi:hypothetical protein
MDMEFYSMRQVFSLLEEITSKIKDEAFELKTKQDLFEAIVNYIKTK